MITKVNTVVIFAIPQSLIHQYQRFAKAAQDLSAQDQLETPAAAAHVMMHPVAHTKVATADAARNAAIVNANADADDNY